ncbi:4-hydroxy-tetrahydrodipicolinate synthase [Oceanobacillus timonensis]|uniref:4-hydroxy-tetrahydrodipicolinate synthase n=1 Tax=Oceanobacillus timonensis TaxID=1926285 RepID=UPI0009B9E6A0|nr:4-hydroxy-tetrahydrodipicolinate synthase [Oceanobacillus timonensis]
MNFGKVVTAMVTPFNEQQEIDYEALDHLIEHLIANGSDGVVVAGTTGESPTLSNEEKLALFSHTVQKVNGRITVIAGTGSNETKGSIALSQAAEKTGVDAIMLVTPYYNKPSQDGLHAHFKTIADSVQLPVMLYNVPGRTSVDLAAETVIRLSTVDNIVAIKDASGNMDKVTEMVAQTDASFSVYSGEDAITLPSLAVGAVGIVSVSAHVIGNEMQEMITAYEQGEVKKAASIHQRILPVMQEMFAAPSPAPVKAALNRKAVNVGGVRLPLLSLNDEQLQSLNRKLELLEQVK